MYLTRTNSSITLGMEGFINATLRQRTRSWYLVRRLMDVDELGPRFKRGWCVQVEVMRCDS